jgi:NADH dehydrogenase [ubiquinone] 1 alpha subcomplex assembly factor 6
MVRIAKRSQGRLFSMQRADIDKYCMENVKSHDYESFLGGLLFPKEYRGLYFALHAFNVEIATIRDQVPRNSTNAARIRFLFWKDVFQQIYGGSGLSPSNNQPVAQALSYYIKEHKLTSRWFERALEARYKSATGVIVDRAC